MARKIARRCAGPAAAGSRGLEEDTGRVAAGPEARMDGAAIGAFLAQCQRATEGMPVEAADRPVDGRLL
ncbi:hypothetical protein ACU4GD_41665 [Cupriavidus basilensis]